MRLPHLATAIALALFVVRANAQVGIYGDFNASHLADKSIASSSWLYGPGIGVYYNFLHVGPVMLGADLRGNFLFGNKQRYRSELLGLRIAAKPPALPIRPYAQASFGLGGSKYDSVSSLQTIYSNKFAYQVAGGIDYTFFPHLDLRLAEVDYTRVTGASDNAATNRINVVSLSTGVVFRF